MIKKGDADEKTNEKTVDLGRRGFYNRKGGKVMKKKIIWGIGIFIAVTAISYLGIFSGRDMPEIWKLGESMFFGVIAGIITFVALNI